MHFSNGDRSEFDQIKTRQNELPDFGMIYVTGKFVGDIHRIYGGFTSNDDEYPALGVTIAESPVFVECLEYPHQAIVRRKMTDEIIGDHPAISSMWYKVLDRYDGKCRYASVHIHPMDLPRPSSVDINNYESVRTNPDAFNTMEGDKPFPFILINLHNGELRLLGFWVMNGECYESIISYIADDDPVVRLAWRNAPPLAYYSEESRCVNRVRELISNKWIVSLGVKKGGSGKAMRVEDDYGNRLILAFDQNRVLGLRNPMLDKGNVRIEEYIDWEHLFESLIEEKRTLANNNDSHMKVDHREEDSRTSEKNDKRSQQGTSDPGIPEETTAPTTECTKKHNETVTDSQEQREESHLALQTS